MIKELFNLIKKQKYNEIMQIINSNTDINLNYKFENENYFIEYVIQSKNIELIKIILNKNISLDFTDSNGNTILYNLIKFNNDTSLEILKILLDTQNRFGINLIDKLDIYDRNCFYYCVLFNNTDAFDILFKFNKNLISEFYKDKEGNNLLLYSLKINNPSICIYILNILLKNNIKLNSDEMINNNGENLLHLGIISQSIDIINILLNNYDLINFNQKTVDDGYTPLHLMLYHINQYPSTSQDKLFDIIKLLTKHTNLFIYDNFGNNILHHSIKEMKLDILEYFLDKMDLNNNLSFFDFTNIEGFTPLHLLIWKLPIPIPTDKKFLKIIKILINNINLNIQNMKGDTSIHVLLKRNMFIEFSDLLENKEINLFIQNKKTITPFDLINKYSSDDNSKIMDIIYKSYYNALLKISQNKNLTANKRSYLENWEIQCSNKINDKSKCIQKIKEIIISNKEKSMPSMSTNIILNDTDDIYNTCFFTGFQIDTLFGLLLLKDKFNIPLALTYPLTINDDLESLYKTLGVNYKHSLNFNNIMISWVYQNIIYPRDFETNIFDAYTNKEIIIIPIGIEVSNGAHTNILYCDFKNNTIERFEPNGSSHPINFNYNPELLDKILSSKFDSIIKNSTVKYYTPLDYLPAIGFSIIENIDDNCTLIGDPNGFCTVWCIWFCYQKLLNKNNKTSPYDFVKELIKILKLKNTNFKQLIRDFSKNISQLRDLFLEKYKLNINDWINFKYSEDILISIEKDIITSYSIK